MTHHNDDQTTLSGNPSTKPAYRSFFLQNFMGHTPRDVDEPFANPKTNVPLFGYLSIILYYVLFGIPAAYLSWKANTQIEMSTPWKIFFAFFAFWGALGYLFSFLIYRLGSYFYLRNMILLGRIRPLGST